MAITGKQNELCPCGSGMNFEDCCLPSDVPSAGRMDAKQFSRAVLNLLESRQSASLAEAQAFLNKATAAQNAAPLEEFDGLSPEQMYRFLYQPFDSPGLIDYNLEITQFPDAPFFRLFSCLMQGVAHDDLKATVNGNLPQKFVQAVAPLHLGEKKYAEMRRYMTFRTETDIMALHVMRLTAEAAGFIRKYKKHFRTTKAGQRVVEQGMDGAAFLSLFQAYTRKFNWAYADRYPDIPTIQQAFLYTLYLLSKHGAADRPASFYGTRFVNAFPIALRETPEVTYQEREEHLLDCYATRTLGRFGHFFGFLRTDDDGHTMWGGRQSVRKAAFLDDWIRFSPG